MGKLENNRREFEADRDTGKIYRDGQEFVTVNEDEGPIERACSARFVAAALNLASRLPEDLLDAGIDGDLDDDEIIRRLRNLLSEPDRRLQADLLRSLAETSAPRRIVQTLVQEALFADLIAGEAPLLHRQQ